MKPSDVEPSMFWARPEDTNRACPDEADTTEMVFTVLTVLTVLTVRAAVPPAAANAAIAVAVVAEAEIPQSWRPSPARRLCTIASMAIDV